MSVAEKPTKLGLGPMTFPDCPTGAKQDSNAYHLGRVHPYKSSHLFERDHSNCDYWHPNNNDTFGSLTEWGEHLPVATVFPFRDESY